MYSPLPPAVHAHHHSCWHSTGDASGAVLYAEMVCPTEAAVGVHGHLLATKLGHVQLHMINLKGSSVTFTTANVAFLLDLYVS